jgi:K+-sensing histidine kinase KdpD
MRIVTHEPSATRQRPTARRAGLPLRRRFAGALTGLVVLPLLTVVLAQLRDILNLPSQTLFYLLAVVVVALVGGLVPALAAAVAAAVLLDHYFIPPLYDFDVADPDKVVALVAFVLVADAASWVVGPGRVDRGHQPPRGRDGDRHRASAAARLTARRADSGDEPADSRLPGTGGFRPAGGRV